MGALNGCERAILRGRVFWVSVDRTCGRRRKTERQVEGDENRTKERKDGRIKKEERKKEGKKERKIKERKKGKN